MRAAKIRLRSLRRHNPDQVRRVTRFGGTLSLAAPLLAGRLRRAFVAGKKKRRDPGVAAL